MHELPLSGTQMMESTSTPFYFQDNVCVKQGRRQSLDNPFQILRFSIHHNRLPFLRYLFPYHRGKQYIIIYGKAFTL